MHSNGRPGRGTCPHGRRRTARRRPDRSCGSARAASNLARRCSETAFGCEERSGSGGSRRTFTRRCICTAPANTISAATTPSARRRIHVVEIAFGLVDRRFPRLRRSPPLRSPMSIPPRRHPAHPVVGPADVHAASDQIRPAVAIEISERQRNQLRRRTGRSRASRTAFARCFPATRDSAPSGRSSRCWRSRPRRRCRHRRRDRPLVDSTPLQIGDAVELELQVALVFEPLNALPGAAVGRRVVERVAIAVTECRYRRPDRGRRAEIQLDPKSALVDPQIILA